VSLLLPKGNQAHGKLKGFLDLNPPGIWVIKDQQKEIRFQEENKKKVVD